MIMWEKQNETEKSSFKRLLAWTIFAVLVAFVVIMAPEYAHADPAKGGLSAVINMMNMLITVLFLPLGILIASAKMIYIAVFGGMFGMDPLNIMGARETGVAGDMVTKALKSHLFGFAKGLAWVAGLFVVFKVALGLASVLASQVETTFGTTGTSSTSS